eukprot:snap_masked-scaffold_50-processed-gene-1.53-mRNA-1 protein AED:1.00 eAED:1.00 QI:0/-1/0/0/-1/1/1/0/249
MNCFLQFEKKTQLREKVIEKWYKYSEIQNINTSKMNILALDVCEKDRMNYLKRKPNLSYFGVQSFCQRGETTMKRRLQELSKKLLKILLKILFELIALVVSLCLCVFSAYLAISYADSFVGNRTERSSFLSQNIVVSSSGVYIYYKDIKETLFWDMKISPQLFCLRFFGVADAERNPIWNLSDGHAEMELYFPFDNNIAISEENVYFLIGDTFSTLHRDPFRVYLGSRLKSIVDNARENFIQNGDINAL